MATHIYSPKLHAEHLQEDPDHYLKEEESRILDSKVVKEGNLVEYIQRYIEKREVISNIIWHTVLYYSLEIVSFWINKTAIVFAIQYMNLKR